MDARESQIAMWRAELVEELKRARPGERSGIISSYVERTGYNPTYLYQVAKKHGFSSGRKKREDTGALRCGLNEDQIQFICSLLHITGRENKGPIMPVDEAIGIAEDNGVIGPGQVTPATMNRILRQRLLSKAHLKAPEPHTEMRSLHPNHCHAFDVSVCIQYYLKNGGIAVMDSRDFYKNKPQNYAKVKTRLLRYVVVDHFSGAFFFHYYDTSGETQNNLFDFLVRAWRAKATGSLPFRGVPFLMLMDTGSANSSGAVLNFLGRLGVEIPDGMPYNPRRQGVVESMHRIIEERFESRLRLQPAQSVESLNSWALDFMAHHQATRRHTRHRMTRTQCWLLIRPEQLRELPPMDILQDLYANPEEECTVDGRYRIRFRGNEYVLGHVPGLFRGAKVQAILKPWQWPVIDVRHGDTVYQAAPLESLSPLEGAFSKRSAIIGKEFKAPRETETQKAKKRALNLAYGEDGLDKRGEPKKGAVPFAGGLKVFGHHAEKLGDLAFIPKEGTPIEVDRGMAERRVSIMEFLKRLLLEIGAIKPELNAAIRARYGDSIGEMEAAEVVEHIRKTGSLPKEEAGGGRESIAI